MLKIMLMTLACVGYLGLFSLSLADAIHDFKEKRCLCFAVDILVALIELGAFIVCLLYLH